MGESNAALGRRPYVSRETFLAAAAAYHTNMHWDAEEGRVPDMEKDEDMEAVQEPISASFQVSSTRVASQSSAAALRARE